MPQIYYIILKTFIFLILILLFTFMPIGRNTKGAFGILLPPENLKDKSLLKIKNLYRYLSVAAGALLACVNLILCLSTETAVSDVWMQLLLSAYCVWAFMIYFMARKAVQALKKRLGWSNAATHQMHQEFIDPGFTESSLTLSVWWFSAHAALIASTAALLYFFYPHMQGYLPTGIDIAGKATGYAPKSLNLIMLLVLVQILITLLCIGVYNAIRHSRLRLDPVDAESSLAKSRRFRILWSGYIIALAFLLDIAVVTAAQFMYITPQLLPMTPYLMGGILIIIVALTLFLGYYTSRHNRI